MSHLNLCGNVVILYQVSIRAVKLEGGCAIVCKVSTRYFVDVCKTDLLYLLFREVYPNSKDKT